MLDSWVRSYDFKKKEARNDRETEEFLNRAGLELLEGILTSLDPGLSAEGLFVRPALLWGLVPTV